MDSNQEDHFATLLKVDAFNTRFSTELAVNPLIGDVDTALDTLRADIITNDIIATRDITGFATAKRIKRELLEASVLKIADALVSKYRGADNYSKVAQFNYPASSHATISEEALFTRSEEVWREADPIKATLGPQLVTAADVDALATHKSDFFSMISIPRIEEGYSKAAREKVARLLGTSFSELLDKLDDLMLPFRSANPELYSQYLTARMIDNTGGNSGSEGYEVNNFTVPAGGSITVPTGPGPLNPDLDLYMRAINGSVLVCTTDLPASPCVPAAAYPLAQGVTFKGAVSNLGIDLNKTHLQFTNPGLTDVLVRAGVKV